VTDLAIRLATEADLPAVREIYNHYVHTSTATFQLEPDTEAERQAWFRSRGEKHPANVAVSGGKIVGWASLSAWKERAAYDRTVEASVYVRAGFEHRGIGRTLLVDLIDRARALGHRVVIGGACTEHPASIALQASLGFVPVGTFRSVGYKFGRCLDVTYLQLELDANTRH
jgi:L-amino acid N-acyltransferase